MSVWDSWKLLFKPLPAPVKLTPPEKLCGMAELGDIVMYYQCDGCMAEVHKLIWVGRVVGFEPYGKDSAMAYSSPRQYTEVICEVIKEGNLDYRDESFKWDFMSFTREDGCAQRLADNLIVVFK